MCLHVDTTNTELWSTRILSRVCLRNAYSKTTNIQSLHATFRTAETRIFLVQIISLTHFFEGMSMSSFEIVRGSTWTIADLPQLRFSDEIFNAHQEQVESSAPHALKRIIIHNSYSTQKCYHNKKGHSFERGRKLREWHDAFVSEIEKYVSHLLASLEHCKRPKVCAYEDA